MNRLRVPAATIAVAVGLLSALISACGSGDAAPAAVNSPQSKAAIEQFRSTMKLDAAFLVVKTRALLREIEAGEGLKAASRYAMARVRYSQVEPLSEQFFRALDLRIDAHDDEVQPDQFGGFHPIEKTLLIDESLDGLQPLARQLLVDVEELRRRIKTADLRAVPIAEGAAEVIARLPAEVKDHSLSPYSGLDLVDAAANVEGAEAAFKAVKPSLVEVDSELAQEIEAQFAKAYKELNVYGTLARDPNQQRDAAPGALFVLLTELEPATIAEVVAPIEVLGEQLSQVPEQIDGE